MATFRPCPPPLPSTDAGDQSDHRYFALSSDSLPRVEPDPLPLQLNNSAVSLIQLHRYGEALYVLEHALIAQSRAEQEAHAYGESVVEALSASLLFDTQLPFIISVTADASGPVVGVQGDADLVSSPSNHFAVFNRAYLFDLTLVATKSALHRVRIVPAILLYNMGLVFHRKALESSNGADAYQRANGFYQLSLSIIEENQSLCLHSSESNLLQLALYNNIGFISSHFFEENDSTVCAGRLLATFVGADTPRLLSKDEYVFYYMNLLFLLYRSPIVAPAA